MKHPPEVWFDGVDPSLLDLPVPQKTKSSLKTQSAEESVAPSDDTTSKGLVKENSSERLTKALAMDCEMVGVGDGGETSILARVSLVNNYGHCVYDKFVQAKERVTDYRTFVSGVRPQDMKRGELGFDSSIHLKLANYT